ncbi:hypothetical protein [Aliarcobacter skirrowii]|uniref:Uncharacterized protein n=1 Tax=Aliarcobacter skirrowii CCUG 10374 TaxID=1032239 RepID=A0AAD0WNQ0_9BACT|nr:hypothetical protein [Aliarcobacter skirrowii]AXX84730.1 hypothetical protein ASKIR_0913 [Aliarcobacter skirrowii CCUG 10374]KAB0620275.1 hypothetical protein F7P70_08480 [Aliarcobacter skirrowii CCUG 10374]RXI25458.1 hypothetical protein CP959_08510 [Aliarcobacter skirrowii CCUG 10374]SUV14903.1 Uncharacterised protein [Aliarcobacter skirrowii]
MKKLILLLVLFLSINANSNFDNTQNIAKKVKEIIEMEERFINSFENHIIQDFRFVTPSYIADNELIINNSIKNFDKNQNILSFSSNLPEELQNDSFAKNLYESSTYRDRSYFIENKIYFNLQNPLAKLLATIMLYKNINSIDLCPEKYTSKIELCHLEDSIYVDVEKYDYVFEDSSYKEKPSKFLLAFSLNSFKNGPIIIEKIDEDEPIFNIFSNGTIFYDRDGIKYLKIGDENAKDKKFANLSVEE